MRHASAVELGIAVHLRDVETMDDAGDVTAPSPVEPGDLVATAQEVWRVEVMLPRASDHRFEPVLARRVSVAG